TGERHLPVRSSVRRPGRPPGWGQRVAGRCRPPPRTSGARTASVVFGLAPAPAGAVRVRNDHTPLGGTGRTGGLRRTVRPGVPRPSGRLVAAAVVRSLVRRRPEDDLGRPAVGALAPGR